jgi:hypothetical protein
MSTSTAVRVPIFVPVTRSAAMRRTPGVVSSKAATTGASGTTSSTLGCARNAAMRPAGI